MSREPTTRDLLCYLEGEVTRSRAAAIEAELAADGVLRARLEELRTMLRSLEEPPPTLARIDVIADVRAALEAEPPRRRRRAAAITGAAVAAAAAVLVLVASPGAPPDSGFRSKAANGVDSAERWAGIGAYRVAPGAAPRLLGERLDRGDGLVFAYTNLGPRPFDYLMVFALDRSGRVYWFYPAYERSADDPAAVAIRRDRAGVELPDLIHHELAPGPLVLYGLFSSTPLRVSEVESLIRDLVRAGRWNPSAPPRLPLSGTAQHIQVTQVGP